jgi:hypothetical protein
MVRKTMKCGCTENSKDENGNPFCVIHYCSEVEQEPNRLEGRTAKCAYTCGKTAASNVNLPFFQYQQDKETDSFYCGCLGWD